MELLSGGGVQALQTGFASPRAALLLHREQQGALTQPPQKGPGWTFYILCLPLLALVAAAQVPVLQSTSHLISACDFEQVTGHGEPLLTESRRDGY